MKKRDDKCVYVCRVYLVTIYRLYRSFRDPLIRNDAAPS